MACGHAQRLMAAMSAAVAAVLAGTGCLSAPPTTPVVPVAQASPTPSPTASPSLAPLTGTASVARRNPRTGSQVGVSVVTSPGARITIIAHFEAGDRKKTARADATGLHILVPRRQRPAWNPGQGGCPRVCAWPEALHPDMVHPAPACPSASAGAPTGFAASAERLLPGDQQRTLLRARRVLPACRRWHERYRGGRRGHHLRRQQRLALGTSLTCRLKARSPALMALEEDKPPSDEPGPAFRAGDGNEHR